MVGVGSTGCGIIPGVAVHVSRCTWAASIVILVGAVSMVKVIDSPLDVVVRPSSVVLSQACSPFITDRLTTGLCSRLDV